MQTVTKKQLRDRLAYLETLKSRLERGIVIVDGEPMPKPVNMVQKMLQYRALPQPVKEQLINDWEAYYELVRHSRAYERYGEQREAYRRKDFLKVKELAAEARADLENKTDWIPKPSSVHPEEFGRHPDCQQYWGIVKKIGEVKEALKRMGDEEALAEEIFA